MDGLPVEGKVPQTGASDARSLVISGQIQVSVLGSVVVFFSCDGAITNIGSEIHIFKGNVVNQTIGR